MKAGLKINKILAACVVALAAPTAFAQSISVSDTNATINTAAHQSQVTIDRQGATVNGFVFELDYDTTRLSLGAQHTDVNTQHPRVSVASGTGAADFGCVENTIGTLRCVATSPVTSATYVINVSFSTLANTGVAPLTIDAANSNYVNAAFADTPFAVIDNGSVTIAAAPANPTTVNFAPTTVNLANGGAQVGQQSAASNVAVTTAGGTDPGSYSCTQPAGFTLTNAAANGLAPNSDPADISVTCTLGAAATSAQSTCTRTGGADVVLTLNCPAGVPAPAPVITPNPASGTALSCNGAPNTTSTTQVVFQNTGNAAAAGLTCVVNGAGFSLQTAPNPAPAAGASTTAVVACQVPAEGVTINGSLNCTSTAPAGGTFTYPLSSAGSSSPVPARLTTIPASSLWTKIGLFGLLAVLGALVIGFRRHS